MNENLQISTSNVFLSAGASSQRHGAIWCTNPEILYYISKCQIIAALQQFDGIHSALIADHTLVGHTGKILCIAQFTNNEDWIVSGSADTTVRIWNRATRKCAQILKEHTAPVYAVCGIEWQTKLFIVSADTAGFVKAYTWNLLDLSEQYKVLQEWQLQRYAVSLAITELPLPEVSTTTDSHLLLAVGTTDMKLITYLYDGSLFNSALVLTGHENWISSLDFITVTREHASDASLGLHPGDILLASGSHDRFIRLWRFTFQNQFEQLENSSRDDPSAVVDFKLMLKMMDTSMTGQLSTKAHVLKLPGGHTLNVLLDSVLMGHDDWIASICWAPRSTPLRLASVSADKSLMIWAPLEGVWNNIVRVGEMGGLVLSLHSAIWRSDARAVAYTTYSGAVQIWHRQDDESSNEIWEPQIGLSGHTNAVRSVCWDPTSTYLLTSSNDQTTRVFAPWRRNNLESWHEIARPQIHGYDLHYATFINSHTLISCADEKVARVFSLPRTMVSALQNLGALTSKQAILSEALAVGANLPALGLSNKAISEAEAADPQKIGNVVNDSMLECQSYGVTASSASALMRVSSQHHPPLEEQLLQHTLWPEIEKLYGHGYEVVTVACSPCGRTVVSTCKATATQHAVLRTYRTDNWQETGALECHTLTVISTKFSPCGRWLLSSGRDRSWALWQHNADDTTPLKLIKHFQKAHARIIWDSCWSKDSSFFVTGSRDKCAKVWAVQQNGQVQVEEVAVLTLPSAVTSTALVTDEQDGNLRWLALGLESGDIRVYISSNSIREWQSRVELSPSDAHTESVTAVSWQLTSDETGRRLFLASGGEEGSIRIIEIKRGACSAEI